MFNHDSQLYTHGIDLHCWFRRVGASVASHFGICIWHLETDTESANVTAARCRFLECAPFPARGRLEERSNSSNCRYGCIDIEQFDNLERTSRCCLLIHDIQLSE